MQAFFNSILIKVNLVLFSRSAGKLSTVMIGVLLSQLTTFLAYPILTRLYEPAAFGVLGSFNALSAIFTPLAALCLPIAIVLPKSDSEARNIAQLSIIIAMGLSLLSVLALFLISNLSDQFNLFKILGDSVYWLGPMILFSSWLQVSSQTLTRYEYFGCFSICITLQAIATNGLKVFFGQLEPSGNTLIIGTVIGPLTFAITYLILSKPKLQTPEVTAAEPIFAKFFSVAKKYNSYPLYRTPQVMLSTLSQAAPVFLLATFFDAEVVGFYVLAKLILDTPGNLIGRGVASVVYPQLANRSSSKYFQFKLLSLATFGLFIIGVFLFITMFFFGTEIFVFIFGSNWMSSGKFAEVLSVLAFTNLLNKACVSAIPVLNLEKWLLSLELVSGILRLLIMLAAYYISRSALDTILWFAIAGASAQIYLVAIILKRTHYRI